MTGTASGAGEPASAPRQLFIRADRNRQAFRAGQSALKRSEVKFHQGPVIFGWREGVDNDATMWEFPTMHTLVVDSKKRVRLPDTQPNQVFAYERQGEGRIVLTRLVKEAEEAFPRGSLKRYLTREKAAEELVLLNGCSLEVPE